MSIKKCSNTKCPTFGIEERNKCRLMLDVTKSVDWVPYFKIDEGKPRMSLLFHGLSRACLEVSRVLTFGAEKHSDTGWLEAPDGVELYTDAMYRHLNAEAGGENTAPDSGLLHAAHAAADALIRLELIIKAAADK